MLAIRTQDYCLPSAPQRRLSPVETRISFQTTTIQFSGLDYAAYILDSLGSIHTLMDMHPRFTTESVAKLTQTGFEFSFSPVG